MGILEALAALTGKQPPPLQTVDPGMSAGPQTYGQPLPQPMGGAMQQGAQNVLQPQQQQGGVLGALRGGLGGFAQKMGMPQDPQEKAYWMANMLSGNAAVGRTAQGLAQGIGGNMQAQSIKERQALAKQELDQRRAELEMSQSQAAAVRQAALDAMKTVDRNEDGKVDDPSQQAYFSLLQAAAASSSEKLLSKAAEMMAGNKAAGPASGIGKLQADLKAGFIDQAGYDVGVQGILRPTVSIGQEKKMIGSEARSMRNAKGEIPPPTLSYEDAVAQGFGYVPNEALNPTDQQRTAKGFLGRMEAAEKLIDSFTAAGFDPASIVENVRGSTNITASPTYRQYKQAAMDWIRAKLRKESGAVIGEQEMADEFKTYFPQVGDDEATQAQKARARRQAQSQMDTSSASVAPKSAGATGDYGADPDALVEKYLGQ